jgi:hypothetical protein
MKTLMIIIFTLFIICGCGRSQMPSRDTDSGIPAASSAAGEKGETQKYITNASESMRYSLLLQQFNEIFAGNNLIKYVDIYYSTYLNPDQNGYATKLRWLSIQLSYFGDGVDLTTISEYDAQFESEDLSISPPLKVTERDVIAATDINTYIFNYLTASQDNINYFFNGEEFSEVGDPYKGSGHINPNDYALTHCCPK